jgi:hypothetical protein
VRNEVKCCCGATATFQTFTNGMGEAHDTRQAYDRWMVQHNGCPALYAPKAPPAPVIGSPITYHEPRFGHGGIPLGDTATTVSPQPHAEGGE